MYEFKGNERLAASCSGLEAFPRSSPCPFSFSVFNSKSVSKTLWSVFDHLPPCLQAVCLAYLSQVHHRVCHVKVENQSQWGEECVFMWCHLICQVPRVNSRLGHGLSRGHWENKIMGFILSRTRRGSDNVLAIVFNIERMCTKKEIYCFDKAEFIERVCSPRGMSKNESKVKVGINYDK